MDLALAVEFLNHYSNFTSAKIPGRKSGSVHAQTYPSGPRRWQANLHLDEAGGNGGWPAQVTVWCCSVTGEVTVEAEARRHPRRKTRLVPSAELMNWGRGIAAHLDSNFLQPAAAKAGAQ